MREVYPGDLRPWEQVGEGVVVVQSRFGTVRQEKWRNPVNGAEYTFPAQVEIGNYLTLLPLTLEGNLVITNQWKQGTKMLCPQFPGGALKEGQDLKEAAAEKLLAETGYQAEVIEVWPTQLHFFDSRCPNWYQVALCLRCRHVGRPESPSTAVIQVLEVTPTEFWNMIDYGDIHEPSAYVAALLALRRGRLML